MIPGLRANLKAPHRIFAGGFFLIFFISLTAATEPPQAVLSTPAIRPPPPAAVSCLPSGDGYLKARLQGSLDASIDWPNAGTRCEGEERPQQGGLRLSFRRDPGSAPDLLFVFGVSKVRENQPAKAVGVNVTLILQGSSRIFGTQSESRCTVDALRQTRLIDPPGTAGNAARRYRVEARGFCTGPAHAIRGEGSVLLTTFDFAGAVSYDHKEQST